MPDNQLSPLSVLRARLLDISYRHKLSHLGSCLTMLLILYDIYSHKKPEDIVVLSAGHAGLAQYVILEDLYGHDAEKMLEDFGIHPERCLERDVLVSSGSLGCAVTIAVGLALGNPKINVHCASSDGESREGSVYEALSFAQKIGLNNLNVYFNINGYSALEEVDSSQLIRVLSCFDCAVPIFTNSDDLEFMKGLDSHYHVMSDDDYTKVTKNAS